MGGGKSGTLSVLAAAALFGTAGAAAALLAPDAPPLGVAAVRLAIGAAGLVGFVLWAGGGAEYRLLLRAPIVWLMALGMAGYQSFFFIAVSRAGVAVGTLVALGSAPWLAGLLGWAAREGAPGWRWAGATALSLTGLTLLTTGGPTAAQPLGVAAAVAAGASFALYTVLGGRLARAGHDSAAIMAAPFTLAAVLLAPFLAHSLEWIATPSTVVLALWLGLAATSLAYLLFASGLRTLQPGHVATLTLLEPVVAAALAVAVVGETLHPAAIAGAVLILAGLTVLAVGPGRPGGVLRHGQPESTAAERP